MEIKFIIYQENIDERYEMNYSMDVEEEVWESDSENLYKSSEN